MAYDLRAFAISADMTSCFKVKGKLQLQFSVFPCFDFGCGSLIMDEAAFM